MKWRVKTMCDNCPFATSGPGFHLRKSLGRGRWAGILHHLMADGHFHCHKTVLYDDEGEGLPGSGKICAGSLEWQIKNLGYVGNLARIMERVDCISASKKDCGKAAEQIVKLLLFCEGFDTPAEMFASIYACCDEHQAPDGDIRYFFERNWEALVVGFVQRGYQPPVKEKTSFAWLPIEEWEEFQRQHAGADPSSRKVVTIN